MNVEVAGDDEFMTWSGSKW